MICLKSVCLKSSYMASKYRVGIDQSLSCTGVCVIDENDTVVSIFNVPTFQSIIQMANKAIKDETRTMYLVNRDNPYMPDLVRWDRDKDKLVTVKPLTKFTKDEKNSLKLSVETRLSYITDIISDRLSPYIDDITTVTLEGISYGSLGQTATLGQVLGFIGGYLDRYIKDVVLTTATPMSLKSFAGVLKGKHKYSKDTMRYAMKDNFNVSYDKMLSQNKDIKNLDKFDDMVDAFYLALIPT